VSNRSRGGLATVLWADDSAPAPSYRASTTLTHPKGDPMKRLTMFTAVLLVLAAVSFALAAGGPGKFETTLTGKGANTEHGALDGTWTIDLANPSSGRVKLTWNGDLKGGGKYVISGNTIALTPKKGGWCKATAEYAFKLSGTTLTFTPIKDTCAVRRDVLTHGPWTKIG
jgi:hypothetical protein